MFFLEGSEDPPKEIELTNQKNKKFSSKYQFGIGRGIIKKKTKKRRENTERRRRIRRREKDWKGRVWVKVLKLEK